MATFILKNNSGSITAGQLEFNPESKSLALGDGSKVINIAKLNDVNSGSFNISGDLFVSGNANIVGNLTFGDNSGGDTVTVVASLSSSLIPEGNNVHDLGSTTKYWKTGYITSITGSLSGSVNGIDITPFSASVSASIGNLNNTSASHELRIGELEWTGSNHENRIDVLEASALLYDDRLNNLEQHSSSVNDFTASITASYNTTSQSLNVVSQSLVDISASYVATSQSFNIVSSSLLLFSASQYNADSTSFDARLDLVEATSSYLNTTFSQSVDGRLVSLETAATSDDGRLDALELYSSSLKAAFEVSGSGVGSLTTIYGDLKVEGTQSIIHSENLAVKDNLIYLNDSSSITDPDLGIVGNYNDGTYRHTGIYRDSIGGKWRVFKGLTDEPSGSINSGHASFQLADFEANEVSASINGIGNVTAYSASVNSRIINVEGIGTSYLAFTQSYYSDSASFDTRISASNAEHTQFSASAALALNSLSGAIYLTDATQSNDILINSQSVWGAFQSASSYSSSLNNTINSVSQSVSTSLSIVSQSLNTFSSSYVNDSSSFDTRIDNLEIISASYLSFTQSYYSDSASFDTRISASTLTFNDTAGQTGIDFTKVGTQVSAIASGLSTTSDVHFNNITSSGNISSSATIYCDTIVYNTSVGSGGPVLEYETNGTLGNILIKGATSKSIQVVDTITFTGMSQNGSDQYSATGLLMTGSITASLGFSGSFRGAVYSTNGLVSGSSQVNIYDLENFAVFNDAIAGDINQASASAWGAFQSASSYSASFYTTINNLSSSTYQSDATQSLNIANLSSSVYTFSSSIDSRVDVLEGTTHTHSNKANLDTINQNLGTTSTDVQFASLGVGTAPDGTYEFKVAGDIAASGDIVAFNSSDERLKNNIKPIQNGLEKINKISGYEFDWNEDLQKARKGHDVGILAHEIEEILPEAVTRRDNGYLAVDYEKIIPLLIQSVKELSAKVKELENK
jgi:hypothetical protein